MKRSTLAALLVLAALGAYIYWFEREPVSEEDEERIFEVEEAAVDRVELRDHDDPPVVLERREEDWRLLEPVEAEADATEMNLLLQSLTSLGFERVVARVPEVDLESYGLEDPAVRVRFRASGEERGLDFGDDTPTSGNQYARRADGEEIFVVASYLSTNFQKTAWDLRNKRVFPEALEEADEVEPTRVEIDDERGRVALSREEGVWFLEEPYRARADELAITNLVGRFRRAEMAEVVSETGEPIEGSGLAEPRFELRVEFEEGTEPLILELGNERELEVFARTPSRPEIFLLDETYASDLAKEPAELVSKRLLETPVYQVTRVALDERSFEKRTSGAEETWHQIAPEEREVPNAVEDLLFELSATSAERIVEAPDLAALGLDEPRHTLVLVGDEPARETHLRISSPKAEEGAVYVLREGDDVALELTNEAWSRIEPLLTLDRSDARPAPP